MTNDMVKIRNESKAKKPKFIRQDAHKKSKLGTNWRKPKGIDSKLRLKLGGHRSKPGKGYRSPSLARGLSKEGLVRVMVETPSQIDAMNPKKDGAIISGGVGNKRRIELLKLLIEKKITVLNIKKPEEFLKASEDKMKQKKEEKLKKEKTKKGKQKEKEKKAQEKEKKKEESLEESLEDKEKKEKKEKDKVLVTKDVN